MAKRQNSVPPVKPVSPTETQPLWLPKWASVGIILAWIFYAGRVYFASQEHQPIFSETLSIILNAPVFDIFSAPLPLLLSHIAQWAWTLAFLFVAFHAGDFILRKLKIQEKAGLLEIAVSIGLGLFLLSMTVFFLLTFHALYGGTLLGIFALALAASLYRQKTVYNRFLPSKDACLGWLKFSFGEKFCLAVFLLFAGTLFMASFAPEVFYDSLVYHLALPYLWFKDHSFTPLPFLAFSTMPTLTQLNYVWGFSGAEATSLLHGDTLGRMLHFSIGIITTMAVYGYAKPKWGRVCGFLAAILFYAIPVIAMNSWTSGNDVGTGLYQTLGVLCLLLWNDSPDAPKKLWFLSALFIGAALASKYTAIFGAAAAFLIAAHFNFWRSRDAKSRILPSIYYGLVMLLVWSPWLIKNILYTGNPLHPFLHGYFGGQNISDILKWHDQGQKVFFGAQFNIFNMLKLRFLWDFIYSFWNVAMTGNDSVKSAGPILLLFGPVILFFKRWPSPIKITGWIFLLAYFFWYLGNDFARYLAPAYPCMALTLAFAWVQLQNQFSAEIRAILLAVPLCAALAVWSPLAYLIHHVHAPLDVISGKLTRDNYLGYSRATYPNPSYKVYQYANQNLPDDGTRILLLGDNKAFGLERSFYYYTVEYNNPILQTWIKESNTSEDLYAKMKAERLTHMIINYKEFIRLHAVKWEEKDKAILDGFWQKHVKALPYSAEGAFIYEITEDNPPGTSPANLILEIDRRGWKNQSLFQSFMDLGMWDEAIDEGESWVRMGSPIFDLLANLYLRRGKPGDEDKAVNALRYALQRAPQNLTFYKQLLAIHIRRKESGPADQVLQAALRVAPNDPDLMRVQQAFTKTPAK